METDNRRQIEKLEAQIQQLQKTRQCLCDKLKELEDNLDEDNEDDEEVCCNREVAEVRGSIRGPETYSIKSQVSKRSDGSKRSGGSKVTSGSRQSECDRKSEQSSRRGSVKEGGKPQCTCGKKKKEQKEQEQMNSEAVAEMEERLAELVACARGRSSDTCGGSDPRGPTARDRGLNRDLVRYGGGGCQACPQRRVPLKMCWVDQRPRTKDLPRGPCDLGDDDDEEEEEEDPFNKPKSKCMRCQDGRKKGSNQERRKSRPPSNHSFALDEEDNMGMDVACRSPDWPCDDLYKELEPSSPSQKTSPCDPRGLTAEERGYKRGLAHPTVDRTLDLKKYKAFMKKDPRGPPRCRGADPAMGRCDDDCDDDDGACGPGPGPGPQSRCSGGGGGGGGSCRQSEGSAGAKDSQRRSSDRRGSRSVALNQMLTEISTRMPACTVSYSTQPQVSHRDKISLPRPSHIMAEGFSPSKFIQNIRNKKKFEDVVTMCLQMLMFNAYGEVGPQQLTHDTAPEPQPSSSDPPPVVNFESDEEEEGTQTPSKWTICDEESKIVEEKQSCEITEVSNKHQETPKNIESSFHLADDFNMDGVKINYVFNLPAYPLEKEETIFSSDVSKQTLPSSCNRSKKDKGKYHEDEIKLSEPLLKHLKKMITQIVRHELNSWARKAYISFGEDAKQQPAYISQSLLTAEKDPSNSFGHQELKINNESNLPVAKIYSKKETKTFEPLTKLLAEHAYFPDKSSSLPSIAEKRTPIPRKGVPRQKKSSRPVTPVTQIQLTQEDSSRRETNKMAMERLVCFKNEEERVAELWTQSYQICGHFRN